MNVNQKIENTLGVITENIWPLCCPYESPPGKYIVYNPEIDSAECFADDEDQEWTLHMQIHLYTREDYMDDRKTIRKLLRKAGFTVKNCLVVEKGTLGGIGDLKGSYANNSEWIIFCQKGRRLFQQTQLLENRKKEGTQFHKGREPSKKYKTRFPACWFGEEYPKATYNATWQKKHGIYHPTVKNVEFLSWLIQISSTRKELVFDGFMGTGSTALAALANDRDYLGAEINEAYFKIAKKRIKEVFSNV